MTNPDLDLMPADRSYPAVLAYYREQFPILDAYLQVVEEHNQHTGPITEPSTGGVDTITAAKIALSRLDRPCDDLSVQMAYAYVERLRYEVRDCADPIPPSVSCALLGYFVPLAGCLPDVEAWTAMDEEDQRDHAAELAEDLPHEVLPELLRIAMPALLRHVIDQDRRHRNPLHVVKPEPTTTTDPWDSVRLATAALGGEDTDDTT